MSRKVIKLVKRSYDFFGPHQWHFLLFKCTSKVKFFLFCILVPWCKCQVSIHIFLMSNSNIKCSFFHVAMLLCIVGHVWSHTISYTIGMQYIFLVLLVRNGTIIVRKKIGIFQLIFVVHFIP